MDRTRVVEGGAASRGWREKVNVVRLVHPFPSVLVAVLTLVIALFADREVGAATVAALSVGMLCYQFCIGVTNDVVDAADDRAAKPWKPIASGAVPWRAAVLLALAFGAAGLVLTAGEGFVAWLLGLAAASCGILYDLYFKRTRFSWLPYAIAFPLLPVWIFVAVGAWDDLLWWVLPLGAALGLALHLANQAPDVEADMRAGIVSTAQVLGARRSKVLAVALFGGVAAVAACVLTVVDPSRAWLAAAVGLATCVAAGMAGPRLGRDGLFGVMAVGGVGLAVAFLSAV